MMKAFGPEGFKQMQAARKAERLPEAQRRKQVKMVDISGDYACLEDETRRKGVLDVAGFEKTAEGWKVAPVRR